MPTVTMKKILLPIIAILILTGIAWGITTKKQDNNATYSPSPVVSSTATATPVSQMKQFTNTSFGYTLSYPTDLEPIEEYTELEKSDQISLAYKPGTPEYEVRFGVKAVYPGYLENLPTVKESLSTGNLNQFATYLWDSNKNDINPDTKGRTVSELNKITINGQEAYTFTVTKLLTIGKGEAKNQDRSTNYTLNTWQDFQREQQITVMTHNKRFFILFHPAAYSEGTAIVQSIRFN